MATNQILPWATGGGANVLDQATYSSLGERGTGFLAGVAYSSHANKAIRQATLVAAGIGNFIATVGGVDCLDDGSVSNQTSGLITAIQAQVNSTLQWNATTAYAVGQPVVYNNILYIALVANTNSAPPNNSWLPYGFGYLSKSVAGGSNVTLSAVESARQVLSFSGAITANINVLLSSPVPKVWTVANNTTGAFTLTVKNASGGTGVIVPAGSSLMVYSDGTNVVAASQPVDAAGVNVSSSSVTGASRNLTVSATGSSASVSITAGRITLGNGLGNHIGVGSVSQTLNTAASGAGGLDTGSLLTTTWYYVYVLYNSTTGAVSSLASLSSTAPTLPSGYDYSARVGSFYTDTTVNKYPLAFLQKDRRTQYVVSASGNVTAPRRAASGLTAGFTAGSASITWTAVALGAFVPPTARSVQGFLYANSSPPSSALVAPNSNYGGDGSTTNPPPLAVRGANSGVNLAGVFSFVLESTSVYWGSDGSNNGLFITGYEDTF